MEGDDDEDVVVAAVNDGGICAASDVGVVDMLIGRGESGCC